MIATQKILKSPSSEIPPFPNQGREFLLLVFAPREWIELPGFLDRVSSSCPPGTRIAGCSTAGEISARGAHDEVATLTLLAFDKTQVDLVVQPSPDMETSRRTGSELAERLCSLVPDPAFVLVFSDGLSVNGSELVAGMGQGLASRCLFSGGLAGDGTRFGSTVVIADGKLHHQAVVGIVFGGSSLKVACSSVAGWCPFGTFRQVTLSRANMLDEIDGSPALQVYSSYLGPDAEQLPSSGLLYPLEVHPPDGSPPVIRTLLAVDREVGSLTFAGDIPQGSTARLMNASSDQLVNGAGLAAEKAVSSLPDPAVAILVSCVGRKLALASYTDLEVNAVKDRLPKDTVLCGFHSYGEIGVDEGDLGIELHNQTMTVTLITEL
jgi:hypothetical protein